MKIYSGIGSTIPTQRILKNSGNLLIVTDSYDFLQTARITSVIERSNGDNLPIVQNQPLYAYAVLNRVGNDTLYRQNSKERNFLELNFGSNGNLEISQGDALAISFTGLSETNLTELYMLDETIKSNSYEKHEAKIMGREQLSQDFITLGSEFVFIPNFAKEIEKVIISKLDGNRIELSTTEAQFFSNEALSFKTMSSPNSIEHLNDDDVLLFVADASKFELHRKYDNKSPEPVTLHYQYSQVYAPTVGTSRTMGLTGLAAAHFKTIK